MTIHHIVAEELDRGLPTWKALPDPLKPALERHCEKLAELAASLHAAGRDADTIRDLIADLLKSYSADLQSALETKT